MEGKGDTCEDVFLDATGPLVAKASREPGNDGLEVLNPDTPRQDPFMILAVCGEVSLFLEYWWSLPRAISLAQQVRGLHLGRHRVSPAALRACPQKAEARSNTPPAD